MGATSAAIVAIVVAFATVQVVEPHGRLIEPPSRSTMWRYGFNTPPNYNDHELYCGGFSRQWRTNGGKCGICGDPWDSKQPRANEAGGMFGKGIVVRKYERNQVIKVRVELTANHMGYFEFRICPNNNPRKPASQMCLDKHILQKTNGDGGLRYYPGPGNKVFEMHYQLPKDLTCRQCVFQWRYIAGNNWGRCNNGTEAVGCGPQEEFRACSDVTITESDGSADDTINTLVDPEVYVPRDQDEKYNEIDYEAEDWDKEYEASLRDEVAFESVIIIVLVSLLVTVLFFCGLFFYYTRGKRYIENLVKDKDWDLPSLPSLPPMPKVPKKLKVTSINWPLSNVQINKLPVFLNKKPGAVRPAGPVKRVASVVANTVSAANSNSSAAPLPPPRAKRQESKASNPKPSRLATVGALKNGVARPNVPPPAAPTTLEIGAPTSVTINGVTVTSSSPDKSKFEEVTLRSGPTSTSAGVIVPATPALAHEDIPDSMQSQPPPLPNSPPPEEDDGNKP